MLYCASSAIILRTAATAFLLLIAAAGLSLAEDLPAQEQDITGFFRSITGEWVGTCEQSTDGEQADNKFFYAVVDEVSPGTFRTQMEYYRLDKETGAPLKIGDDTIQTQVLPNGSAECVVKGEGTILVNDKPKNQEHEFVESISVDSDGLVKSEGTGKISVFGMPLGLGKNGKVHQSKSVWGVSDDILTINQQITVGFRALFFTKKYNVEARYVAHRGSDYASLMTGTTQASAKAADKS